MQRIILTAILIASFSSSAVAQLPSGWKAHDLSRPAPKVVTPGDSSTSSPPSDAIVLFDGKNLSKWNARNGGEAKWKVVDEAMESVAGSGYVVSKEEFGDCQIHVEFASPKKVKGNGQGRGNSGVFLMDSFEVQVLDSFDNATYPDGSAGSIYGQYPPLVNASRKPGEWQSYDIVFRRPRFDEEGKLLSAPQVTVLHNGIVIQDASEPYGPTNWIQHRPLKSMKNKTKGPISLQDHGNPVRYRNIWVRPLVETQLKPAKPYDPVVIELAEDDAKKLVGKYGSVPISYSDGKLFLGFAGSELEMIPHSKTEFGFKKSAGMVAFTVDEEGNGVSLEMKLDAAGTQKGAK